MAKPILGSGNPCQAYIEWSEHYLNEEGSKQTENFFCVTPQKQKF
jgi:hypothetical protein